MRGKWKITILSSILSVSFLTACNAGNKDFNDREDVDYRPVRYESDTNPTDNNDAENRSFKHDENPDQTDKQMEKGDNLEFNKSRGDL
ncbi:MULTISPECIES: hypothetical protein [Bacillaceae]|uniref:Lipoprotein n=1 Tax=Peribacillus simplex TaxID=1478 RepID=A0A120GQG7_9BACI|nr:MULTISPECIES: hypothetical protein [Bacillaceae]KWW21299.1 hypothetical protein AS888_17045 [Peribacillus simplex]PJN88943.1 hypothetical protein CVN76_18520 [Bacillus sp. mrc49]